MNGTEPLSLEEIEESEPSSIILVLVTMAGRMANVVGIIKLFKVKHFIFKKSHFFLSFYSSFVQGLEIFMSERRKKKLRETAEKLHGGETDTDWTELFSECCAF